MEDLKLMPPTVEKLGREVIFANSLSNMGTCSLMFFTCHFQRRTMWTMTIGLFMDSTINNDKDHCVNHLFHDMVDFVLEQLWLSYFVSHILINYKHWVKEVMDTNGKISYDIFILDEDIWKMARKPTMESYQKHVNDAEMFTYGLLRIMTVCSLLKIKTKQLQVYPQYNEPWKL